MLTTHNKKNMNQKEMLRLYYGRMAAARIYRKFQSVHARVATKKESVVTLTPSGRETINLANPGDYIIRQLDDEQYVLSKEKFESRYTQTSVTDGDWRIYEPTGKIRAYRYWGPYMYFEAPWGEKTVLNNGDFLASPLDLSEIYRIDQKSFEQTYVEDETAQEAWGGPSNGDIRH